MFYSQYKVWPESAGDDTVTKPLLLLLHLKALKFNAQSYMELPIHDYSEEQLSVLLATLAAKKVTLDSYAMNEPERFWHFLHHLFPKHPELVAAYDIMGWDIWAQLYKSSFRKLIRLPQKSTYNFEYIQPLNLSGNASWTPLAQSIDESSTLVALREEEISRVNELKTYSQSDIWVQPVKALLNDPEKLKNKLFQGCIIDPFEVQGFTPMIKVLMELRKLNIPVGMALTHGSILGVTVLGQFAPILQKLMITERLYPLPVTGVSLSNHELVFPPSAGMGIAFVENFW